LEIVAVTISKDALEWKVPEIPFYNHTEGYEDYPHFPRLKTRFRIDYLARRRNAANCRAIQLHPDLTHFLAIDSYYLNDIVEIRQLVKEYQGHENVILGASTWYIDPSRIIKKHWYWDTWTNPEFLGKTPEYSPPQVDTVPEGWQEAHGAGGFCIYPRWAWEKQQYGVPEPFPESGCEANYLSRCDGIKTYITFNTQAWRDPPEELKNKPYINRVRTSLGIRTRIKQLGVPDVSWILMHRVLLPRRRLDWLRGTVEKDGWKWTVRGLNDSHLSYQGHESWLSGEILRKGRVFVDVGAHVGTWTVRASKYYEKVVAFEPTDRTRKLLLKNLELNNVSNVTVYKAALGRQHAIKTINYFPKVRGNGGNSLLDRNPAQHERYASQVVPLQQVTVEPLDDYMLRPDLVKIDTEGYEIPILEGMSETLPRTQRIIVEAHRDEDVLKIRSMLDRAGFKTRLSVSPFEVHVIGER